MRNKLYFNPDQFPDNTLKYLDESCQFFQLQYATQLSDSNRIQTHNHLVYNQTLNYLAKLTKWLSVCLQTKCLWVQVLLQSLNLQKLCWFEQGVTWHSGNLKNADLLYMHMQMLKAHSQCKYPDPPKTWMKNTKKLEKTKPRKKVWYVSLREEWVCMPGWDRCAITLANPHTHHIKNTPMVCHLCKTLVWFPKFSWFIHFLHSKLHFLRFSLFICLSNCIKLFIYFSHFL